MDLEALRAKLRLDAGEFVAGLAGAQQALTGFQGKMRDAGESLRAFGERARDAGEKLTARVTVPVLAAGAFVVKAASDMAEAISATGVVFGENGAAVLKWSETTATQLGIARADALTAANQFAALGQGAGISNDKLVEFSTSLVQAAADLSSFWNVPSSQALADLQSALNGQYEPLQKYGIKLTEASVAQRALADTGKTAVDQLTQAELATARYNLILEGLGPAAGNFALTQQEVANQTRIAQAQFKDAAANLGTLLLPYVLQAVQAFSDLVQRFQGLSPETQKWLLIAAGIAAVIGPAVTIIGALATAIGLLLSPIGLVVLAIAGLVVAYQTNFLGFADGVNAVVDALVAKFNQLKESVLQVAAFFGSVWATIGPAMSAAFELATAIVMTYVDTVVGIFNGFQRSIKGVMTLIKGIFTGDWEAIKTGVIEIVGGLKDAVMETMLGFLAGVKAYLAVFLTAFDTSWSDIYDAVSNWIWNIQDRVGGVLNQIATSVWDKAFNIGSNIGSGLATGIQSMWGEVVGKAQALADAVMNILSKIPGIASPSKVTTYYGKMIGAGLVEGMDAAQASVEAAAARLAGAAMPMPGIAVAGGGSYQVTIQNHFAGNENQDAIADAVFGRFSRELGLTIGDG
jgi:hypothetical protein